MNFRTYRVALFLLCLLSIIWESYSQDELTRVDSLQEVVVTASRFSERQLVAPVSISKLNLTQIRQSGEASFYNAVASMKGIHLITPSLGFKIINTRGFSNTTNVRFVQLIDNIDNQSPHIGAPIATVLSPGDLDIANVEIVQGVASALYGMNATNGLANFITKNPFEFPGLSIQQQFAVNHLNDPNNVDAKLFSETALRWAHVLANKWGFKINAALITGSDWVADNFDDLNPNANISTGLVGGENPGYDAVNGYGNESSNRRTVSLNGKNYVVARTGYAERKVANYNLRNWKGDVSIYYRPSATNSYSYTYRVAQINNIYQRSNRFRLENYLLQQQSFQYKSSIVQARTYVTSENTGDSYNLRSMAENIDNTYKNTTKWYTDYSTAFNDAILSGANAAAAHRDARLTADSERPQPGTATFNERMNLLQQINNWDEGAALKVKAHLLHGEASVNLEELFHTPFRWFAGVDYRNYIIVPDGNYFVNPVDSARNLQYKNYGMFIQGTKDLFKNKLQVGVALRGTKYDYFEMKWNPRLTLVYSVTKEEVLRFSYQKGYRFASIFEGFSNINSGGVKRVGGLRVMSNGIFENSWLKNSIDAFVSAVNTEVNTTGLPQEEAITKHRNLLHRNTYSYLEPEQMHSLEVGYRRLIFQGKLIVDADIYYNVYRNFIAQIEASIPETNIASDIPSALYDRSKQARYRLWTNSKSVVHNYGVEVDTRFIMNRKFRIDANASYQTLKKTRKDDGLEDGYNTPTWIVNASITGTDVIGRLGFVLSMKHQSEYYWQSFLINGNVPSMTLFSGSVQHLFPEAGVLLTLGASNLLNRYYYSILGGPLVGGFYYTTLKYELR